MAKIKILTILNPVITVVNMKALCGQTQQCCVGKGAAMVSMNDVLTSVLVVTADPEPCRFLCLLPGS